MSRDTDVVFLIDASSNVTLSLFNKQKDFVKSLVSHFNIHPAGARGSAVIYGNASFTVAGFNDRNFIGRLNSAALLETPRRSDKALQHAVQALKDTGRDGRKIVVLLTTGKQHPSGKFFDEAKRQLHELGAQTSVVAIGRLADIRELYYVVDRPTDIYRVISADDLERQSRSIAKSIREKPGMKQKQILKSCSFI